MRVLVVDDEPQLRRALERALKLEGYDVELAADGAEALGSAARTSIGYQSGTTARPHNRAHRSGEPTTDGYLHARATAPPGAAKFAALHGKRSVARAKRSSARRSYAEYQPHGSDQADYDRRGVPGRLVGEVVVDPGGFPDCSASS